MKDKVFIDTNVLVYAKLEDKNNQKKREVAIGLIQQIQDYPIISVQVLNEFANVLIKHHVADKDIKEATREIVEDSIILPIDLAIVWETWHVRDSYLFSYWDSMIVSAAIVGGCNILYSEDLQHDQIIDNRVRIINPFHGIKSM